MSPDEIIALLNEKRCQNVMIAFLASAHLTLLVGSSLKCKIEETEKIENVKLNQWSN